ncbi:PepSY domain-containing protein [Mycobacterium sp. CBMA271]|uniref:PepSY-associated TM helix domain-containing protein n=1 Tax=unclassified Mycobacteroides TaxID=2618759 RepID=UPI00132A209E|nr:MULTISPECIES: PepSY domain-containing protein [unclassified Mycobacteroides]MUM17842.1 peptidase [Mycobacteroides sp. CBMA 326]MUM20413.1 PepSY domain-containing protein [Mycobacteroides sp. CBMA 271]
MTYTEDQPDTRESSPDTGWGRFAPIVLRLHFYAGLLVGPFLLVAALTGLAYALVGQVDAAVYRQELKVDSVGTQQVPLSDQIAAATAAQPDGTVTSIRPPALPEDTTRVVLSVPEDPDVPADYSRTVFVDPYSGQVRGTLTTYGEWLPVRAWFDELHRNLHLGAFGRNYSELAASWLWVVALGGLILWVGYRQRTARLRRLALPDRDATPRRRRLTWHGAVGVWIAIGLLGLSVTGLTWSRYAGTNIGNITQAIRPALSTELDPALAKPMTGHEHHGTAATSGGDPLGGVNTVMQSVRDAGLRGPLWMTPPPDANTAWLVSERKRDIPTRLDAVTVNPANGEITGRSNFADWSLLQKSTEWAIDGHMGILFGIPNQILVALIVIGLITVITRGYLMWWKRRPTQRGRLPAAPRRGGLLALKPVELVVLAVVTIGIGWFTPLLGISLAAFLAIDLAWTLVAGRLRS